MKDLISQQRLAKLHPKVQDSFRHFIDEVESTFKIKLRISQGLRTIEEQNDIYAQGRTKPGKIVTYAMGGQSFHNYGLAIDVVEVQEDGQINWGFNYDKLYPIAQKFGLVWGGTWKGKKVDRPHYQKTLGFSHQDLFEKYKKGDLIPGTKLPNI